MPSYNDSYSNYVDIKGRAERTVYVPPDMGEIMFLVRGVEGEPSSIINNRCLTAVVLMHVHMFGGYLTCIATIQGCKCGDEPITLRCGCCGYNGPSTVTKARGPANIITKVWGNPVLQPWMWVYT